MTRRGWAIFGAVIACAVLLIGVPTAIYVSLSVEQHHTCVKVNKVRTQLLALVDEGVVRNRLAANAPHATEIDKIRYKSVRHGAAVIHAGLPLDHC